MKEVEVTGKGKKKKKHKMKKKHAAFHFHIRSLSRRKTYDMIFEELDLYILSSVLSSSPPPSPNDAQALISAPQHPWEEELRHDAPLISAGVSQETLRVRYGSWFDHLTAHFPSPTAAAPSRVVPSTLAMRDGRHRAEKQENSGKEEEDGRRDEAKDEVGEAVEGIELKAVLRRVLAAGKTGLNDSPDRRGEDEKALISTLRSRSGLRSKRWFSPDEVRGLPLGESRIITVKGM